MKKIIFSICFVVIVVNAFSANKSSINFIPVKHASFIIQSDNSTLFVDPVGEIEQYKGFPTPQLILLTHEHGDHFNKDLIDKLKNEKTTVIGPSVVINQLGYGITMENGAKKTVNGVVIEAIPSYNTTEGRLNFHPKGVGNGYVLTLNGKRIYISGDTEDIPEMRALKNIDYAFVCMNLPYTMTPEQAASAVLEFKPKHVYPYHYRQKEGFSDIQKFKTLVSKNAAIEVVFLKWY
jgi:L-ascorbate metabolism protein UlaG (beta-lactamase superfamily)